MRDRLLIRYLKARRWYKNLDGEDMLTAILILLVVIDFTLLLMYV